MRTPATGPRPPWPRHASSPRPLRRLGLTLRLGLRLLRRLGLTLRLGLRLLRRLGLTLRLGLRLLRRTRLTLRLGLRLLRRTRLTLRLGLRISGVAGLDESDVPLAVGVRRALLRLVPLLERVVGD